MPLSLGYLFQIRKRFAWSQETLRVVLARVSGSKNAKAIQRPEPDLMRSIPPRVDYRVCVAKARLHPAYVLASLDAGIRSSGFDQFRC